jgi:hypothetical protein
MAHEALDSINNIAVQVSVHPDYDDAKYEIRKVRDCIAGSPTIKRQTYTYLPHPSQIDTESEMQKMRYREFIDGAEYDDQPKDTLQTMLGKMRISESEISLPEKIMYLEDDVDGDGQSLRASMEYAIGNILQTKWHVLVADYTGLTEVDLISVSLADKARLNPRASIKQYKRENVVNWHFDRVGGKLQLRWIMLLESGTQFDDKTYTHTAVQSYIILALDDDGYYYQKKIVYSLEGKVEGEPSYVMVNNTKLTSLPVEIVADQELDAGHLPISVGSLHPICEAALYKYRVSAVYKEVQRNLAPTTITSGWQSGDLDLFKSINHGRDYIATGAGSVNSMPNEVKYSIESVAMEMTDFHWYFSYADKKILSMGGVAKQETAAMTATEADINAAEQNSRLTTIADNVENAYERLSSICLMFEGGVSIDAVADINEDINVALPRDFATPKMTVEEVKVTLDMITLNVRTVEQVVTILAQGGWDYQDAKLTLAELESNPPARFGNSNDNNGNNNNNNDDDNDENDDENDD